MNNLLYIGLNGYAGSGKDTVAKIIKTILSKDWKSLEECKEYYFNTYTNPTISATYNSRDIQENSPVFCIAYADQLKEICSKMFGIPLQRFYQNKSTAWVCINDKFQYTEIKPDDDYIITAEDYYYNNENISHKYWMSLRELLVYVGTYVLQQDINKFTFVNIVRNTIIEEQSRNPNLKYVIVTDNRFSHELNFIKENNGITITIIRKSVQQLDNIAEHDLDDVEDYDYIIDNSGTYDELFDSIWKMIHNDVEFENKTVDLYTRDNINNYLRFVKETKDWQIYKLCAPLGLQQLYKNNDGSISFINPTGGPTICIGEPIDGTISNDFQLGIIPNKIVIDNYNNYLIYV